MNALYRRIVFPLLVVLSITGCREAYISPVNPETQNLLVIEGMLYADENPTEISLSRSTRLYDTVNLIPERAANVRVEGEQQELYFLQETRPGKYSINRLPLQYDQKYRLLIRTSNGNEYASDFVPVVRTPEIDSVGWTRDDQKVVVHVSTNDPAGNTGYYKWNFNETWEFHSPLPSLWEYVINPPRIEERLTNDFMTICWKSSIPSTILLSSTSKLNENRVHKFPVTNIFNGEERLTIRYSIEVSQSSLTKEAYEYWDILRKNTEAVGSIFDPQPSVNISNIRNLNDENELVVGYINAGNSSKKRIFITRNELPGWRYASGCEPFLVRNDSLAYYFADGYNIPIAPAPAPNPNGQSTHVLAGNSACVDCRLTGTNIRPWFW